jgi:hypothetical protein
MSVIYRNPEDLNSGFSQTASVIAEDSTDAPSFLQTVGAAFKTDNVAYNAVKQGAAFTKNSFSNLDTEPLTPNEIFDDIVGTQYEDFAFELAFAQDRSMLQDFKHIVDDRLEARETLARSGTAASLTSALIAGTVDITSVMPGGAAFKSLSTAKSVAQTAASVGTAGFAAGIVSEAALQPLQSERTLQESATNVAASTILSGALGGAVGFMGAKRYQKAQQEIADILNEKQNLVRVREDNTFDVVQTPADTQPDITFKDIGAAETDIAPLKKDEGLYNIPEWVQSSLIISPTTRGLTSDFLTVRKFTNDVFEHDFILGKNVRGEAKDVPVETKINLARVPSYEAHLQTENLYADYIGIKEGLGQEVRAALQKGDKLSRDQFGERISNAMRNGDRDIGDNPIPQITQAAQNYRKVFDVIKDDAIDLGLLPENVDPITADSYLTRHYNINKIISESPEFKTVVTDWLLQQNSTLKSLGPEIKRLEGAIAKSTNDKATALLEEELQQLVPRSLRDADGSIRTPFDDNEVNLITDSIYDNIVGFNDTRLNNPLFSKELTNKRINPLKQRAFLIPDELIVDFLDNNITRVTDNYIASMVPRLEVEKYFRAQGLNRNDGISDLKQSLKSEYENQLESLNAKKPKNIEKKRLKLSKKFERANQHVNDSFELLMGIYGLPKTGAGMAMARTLRVVRNYNVTRLLGGVSVSSIPDAGVPIFRHGWKAYIQDGIMPMLRNMKTAKLSRDELRDIGVGFETQNARRFLEMTSGPDAFIRKNKFETFTDKFTKVFGNITLNNQMNDLLKRNSGHIASARILRAVDKFERTGKLSQKDTLHLSRIGIGKNMYKRINDEFKKYGEIQDGSFFSNSRDWTDLQARQAFNSATLTDVNSSVITPGLGDKPLFSRTAWGSVILQFKSYSMGAQNKILLSGLQRRDMQVLEGVVTMLGLGAITYYAQALAANRVPSDDPEKIFLEALDKSGMTGLMFDGFLTMDKFFGITEGGFSRYYTRGKIGAFLGPSAGVFEDLAILGKLTNASRGSEDITAKDLRNLIRLAPYQNLFYVRRIIEQGSENLAESIGLK